MQAGRVQFTSQLPASPPEHDPVEERLFALEDENDQLRAEIARLKSRDAEQGPSVQFKVRQNEVQIRNLTLAGMQIDELTAKFAPGVDLLKEFTLERILEAPANLLKPSLDPLADSPIRVEKLQMQIPSKVANDAARLRGAKLLKEEGLSDLQLSFQPGGRIEATGVLDKLVPLPFTVRGKLELTRDSKIRFTPEKLRVLGFPVPRLAMTIANAIAGDSLKKLDIQTQGNALVIDPASFMPPNVELKLTRLETQGDRLVLEGGPPPPKPPPRTLTA